MFTGIIETTGSMVSLTRRGRGAVLRVSTPASFALRTRVKPGDSIANNGICLTVTSIIGSDFTADVSAETMEFSCFRNYVRGTRINLELACTPQTHLGGHIVLGHCDGTGRIMKISKLDEARDVWIEAPKPLQRYIARKGSIAVDGVSLTVNELKDQLFRVTLIPHTRDTVDFESSWKNGTEVNLEADVLARYLERLLQFPPEA